MINGSNKAGRSTETQKQNIERPLSEIPLPEKPLPEKPSSTWKKFVAFFKNIPNKIRNTLSAFKKSNTEISDRETIKTKRKNYLTTNKGVDEYSDEKDEDRNLTSDEAVKYSKKHAGKYSDINASKSKETAELEDDNSSIQEAEIAVNKSNNRDANDDLDEIYVDVGDTNADEEHLYMNLPPRKQEDLSNNFSKASIDKIKQYMQQTTSLFAPVNISKAVGGKSEEASAEMKAWQIDLKAKSKKFSANEQVRVPYKYKDIPCPSHSAAGISVGYHANIIPTAEGEYIAAQGPHSKPPLDIMYDFVKMLEENKSPISISLVNDADLTKLNSVVPPQHIGETIQIMPKNEAGNATMKPIEITMVDSIKDKQAKLQTDILSINGKKHIRIYDLGWADHASGQAERLALLSLYTEQMRNIPEISDQKDNPITVNCNAGVGRTGTFIMINKMTRKYLAGQTLGGDETIEKEILQLREHRPILVQTAGQLETVKIFSENADTLLKPFVDKFDLNVTESPYGNL